MGITGDHYIAMYEGHAIELVRNNWNKTLKLLVDGQEVGAESRVLPHDITLTATLVHNGEPHTIIAKSIVHFPFTEDTIEIDGHPFPLTRKALDAPETER